MNMVVEMIMATNNNNNNNNNNKGQDVKVEMEEAAASRRWWFHSHSNSKRSPWLQSTLAELDKKTEAMLKLVETDADSFAQRAEMYYRKRLELIAMVEDFYRAYRSLAERYDQLKADSGNRLLSTLCSPFSAKYCPESVSTMDRTYDSPSETYDTEDSAESEVDDPDPEDEMEFHKERGETEDSEENVEVPFSKEERGTHVSDAVSNYELMMLREDIERLKEENRVQKEQLLRKDEEIRLNEEKRGAEVSNAASNAELMKLREEVERLREENRAQKVDLMKKGEEIQLNEEKQGVVVLNSASNAELMKLREELEKLKEENSSQREQLVEKDEDKREVIRQLSLGMEVLKSENVNLRKFVAKHSPKKRNHFEFDKLKEVFMGKFFNGSAKFQAAVIAI